MFNARDWSGRYGSVWTWFIEDKLFSFSEVKGELVVVSPIADMLHFLICWNIRILGDYSSCVVSKFDQEVKCGEWIEIRFIGYIQRWSKARTLDNAASDREKFG